MSGELKMLTQGGSAELDAMRARLEDAEKRLGEADSHHEAEMAKREASAQHELALEKKAAKTAQDKLQAKLDEAQRALKEREAQLEDSRAGTRSATARADAGEASLLRANEQLAAERLRLSEVETEVREAHRRAANWKDERAALQAELHAERRHVELERKHKEALEHSLKNERSVNASIQVLLESRLGELASQQNATELAQGAEALQVLMGRAAASQAALEARELVLADAFALLTSRHSERLGSIERAAEQREYHALLQQRAGAWGHDTEEPPLDRRVVHWISLFAHAIEDQIANGTRRTRGADSKAAHDDAVGTASGPLVTVPPMRLRKLREWLHSTLLPARVTNKYASEQLRIRLS